MKPNRQILTVIIATAFAFAGCQIAPASNTSAAPKLSPPVAYTGTRVAWRAVLQQPAAWYGSDDALGLAVNVVAFQTASGGWPKNLDMTRRPEAVDRSADPGETLANIDNDATTTQLQLLARIISAREDVYLRAAFLKGFDYLLAAQYANGGWPQYFPLRPGYYNRITFNDNAVINVMTVLRDAAASQAPYAFVDASRRARAAAAVAKGIDCILRCQIIKSGQRTVWCAQHDENTFAPAPARSYELASFSGQESVSIVRFLMAIEKPSPEIIAAVRGAVEWFKVHQLTAAQVQSFGGRPAGAQTWARFYDLETEQPIFSGRDGIKKSNLNDIEAERRNGYSWFGAQAAPLLSRDFPAWEQKLAQK